MFYTLTDKVQLYLLHTEFLKGVRSPFLDLWFHYHNHHKEVHEPNCKTRIEESAMYKNREYNFCKFGITSITLPPLHGNQIDFLTLLQVLFLIGCYLTHCALYKVWAKGKAKAQSYSYLLQPWKRIKNFTEKVKCSVEFVRKFTVK